MQRIIKDFRGSSYTANVIEILNNKVIYFGVRVEDIIKENNRSNYIYSVISVTGLNLGSIALSNEDFKTIEPILHPIDFTRVNNDVNGNPRAVCHFLEFIHPSEKLSLNQKYDVALFRSRQLGGRKFHNKQYGGGIVFQMYSGEEIKMSAQIRDIRNSFAVLTE